MTPRPRLSQMIQPPQMTRLHMMMQQTELNRRTCKSTCRKTCQRTICRGIECPSITRYPSRMAPLQREREQLNESRAVNAQIAIMASSTVPARMPLQHKPHCKHNQRTTCRGIECAMTGSDDSFGPFFGTPQPTWSRTACHVGCIVVATMRLGFARYK